MVLLTFLTALLFRVVAHLLINMLLVQQPSEKKAADILLPYYFVKLPADRERGSGLRMPPYLITAIGGQVCREFSQVPFRNAGSRVLAQAQAEGLSGAAFQCSGTCAGIVVVVVLGEVRDADFHLNDKFTKGGRKTKAGGTFQWRVFCGLAWLGWCVGRTMGNFLTIPFG